MTNKAAKRRSGNFRFIDFMIILLFLSTAALCVNLFRNDLRQTILSQNQEAVGTIIIKSNIVQRRLADRVIWDRLFAESPVYPGDLIRVANLSAADLRIEEASLYLDENTLIRITGSPDGDGPFRIDLMDGSLNIDAGPDGGNFIIDLMGSEVQISAGTALSAAATADGIQVQVSEGTAFITSEEGISREIASGDKVSFDKQGAELTDPAVVVNQPRHNARFFKSGPQPLPVSFAWNRLHLNVNVPLLLEISPDRNFSRITRSIETAASGAQLALNAGRWYWRLVYGDAGTTRVLSAQRFIVTDGSEITLLSPAVDSVFLYNKELPQLRFQWAEVEDVSHYILEVSETPDFSSLKINSPLSSAFFTDSSLWPGTWHWRVQPVFASGETVSVYSQASSFKIQRSESDELAVLFSSEEPEPEPAAVAAPPPPPPPPRVVPPPPPPPPPLPAPQNRSPVNGYNIGIEELRVSRSITFSWSPVEGANAYILTLLEQTPSGRREITSIGPQNDTDWILDHVGILGRGTFIWQVEAVNRNSNGSIERRGNVGANSFILDVPVPSPVQVEETGRLYGQ